jgi:hypothetical protein
MNQGKFIFAQLTDFLPRRAFDGLLDKAYVKEVLTKCDYKYVKEQNNIQLKISGF